LVFERLKEVIELGVQRLLERGEHSKNFQQKGIVISLKELDELKKITN
jgi:predicted RNase H-like HicB family nuclease